MNYEIEFFDWLYDEWTSQFQHQTDEKTAKLLGYRNLNDAYDSWQKGVILSDADK